ncbi:MAG: BatA domain-containing protein, partial [Isosphaeraceae bacterium]
GAEEALSTDYPLHCGIYRSAERLLAVSRAPAEDLAPVLADGRVAGLFRGLDLTRIDDRAGNLSALIQEIWRLFMVAMMVAMVVEAALCLPRRRRPGGTS